MPKTLLGRVSEGAVCMWLSAFAANEYKMLKMLFAIGDRHSCHWMMLLTGKTGFKVFSWKLQRLSDESLYVQQFAV